MKFQQWPKRDPNKNYFKVPNEVFHIGLSYPEISIYCYLLSIEDRETYQCYPSYKTIGKALGMSENTVSKYVRSLTCSTPSVQSRRQSNCSMSGSSGSWRRTLPVSGQWHASQNRPVEAPRDRLWAAVCLGSGRGRVPAPPSGFQTSVGRLWEALRHKASGPFCTEPRDERKSRIKTGGAGGSSGRSHLPAVRAVTGDLGVSKVGSKTGSGDHVCGHDPRTPTAITKK